jgi:hypothetical protein
MSNLQQNALLANILINPKTGQPYRGQRNNNLLNIRYNKANNWQGQTGQDDSGFSQFDNRVSGIRAADKILNNYGKFYNIDTVEGMVKRFAPKDDNNPENAYIDNIYNKTGIERGSKINLQDPNVRNQLLPVMGNFETPGANITLDDLQRAREFSKTQPKPSNNIIDAEKSPDFVINIKEDGSYEDFDEEAFEKMFPPLDRPAQDDSNNIVPELTVKDIPVSPPSAIDMMRDNYREGSIERQNLSKQYKEGEVSDRPTVIPLFPKEPLTKQEADVLKRAQDVDQEFNYKKNDMINAEKGFIPQQIQAQPDADVVYDNQGNPYNAAIPAGSVTGLNINQAKFDPTGGQQQSRQDLAKLANYDISIIDGNEYVHEKGLTEKEVEDQYNQRNQNQSSDDAKIAANWTMGEGILQDMSNAVEVPFLLDDFALYENETTGLDKARNLLGEPTTVYRDINGNLVQPNSKEQKPNNLRYLAGLLGSIMADRYGNPSQPEDNFSKYMAYTQDAINQQRLDKQALESTYGNYRDSKGNIVYGGITPSGSFETIPGITAIDDDSSGSSGFPRDVIMGNGSTITMSEEQYKEHKKDEGKNAAERVEKLFSIRQTNFENNKDFNELLNYSDDDLNKLFGQGKFIDTQLRRNMISGTDTEYKSIRDLWEFISDKKAKEAYVNILKGAGSISNYETDIMAKTINNLKVTMSAEKLKEEIAKIQFLGQFHEHNAASAIPGYSDSKGTYNKLDTSEAYKLFLNNEIEDLNDYLNYKSRQ